eukprot:scaffold2394_cov181-Chaetoceros_neogracile.AAC.3
MQWAGIAACRQSEKKRSPDLRMTPRIIQSREPPREQRGVPGTGMASSRRSIPPRVRNPGRDSSTLNT